MSIRLRVGAVCDRARYHEGLCAVLDRAYNWSPG